MTKNELNKEKQRFYRTKKEIHFYNILSYYLEHPEDFDSVENQILGGFWEDWDEQPKALWHYYKGRMARLAETIKNL